MISATKAVAASSAMLPLVTAQIVALERGVGGRISRLFLALQIKPGTRETPLSHLFDPTSRPSYAGMDFSQTAAFWRTIATGRHELGCHRLENRALASGIVHFYRSRFVGSFLFKSRTIA